MLLKLIAKHSRPYVWWIVLVLVFQLASTITQLYLPSLNARIIDEGVVKGDVGRIWDLGGVMLVVAFVQVAVAVAAVWCGSRVAMAVGRDLRARVYAQVSAFSAREVNHFGAATLITRGTNDVQQIQMLTLLTLNLMITAPIMCVGGIIMALREDAGLSWLVWVSVPALFAIVIFLVFKLMPLFQQNQDRLDAINGVLREQITGIRVVRAFTREQHETERFGTANDGLTKIGVRVGNLFVLMFPLIMLVLEGATTAVLWFGGHRVDAGHMEVGSLTAFMQYLMQILTSVMMGTFMAMMVPRAMVSANRIGEVLDTEPSVSDAVANDPAPVPGAPAVEFRGVAFGYPGAEKNVVQGLDFVAEAGKTTAIIGSTGAGKTTLLNLIPRLYDPDRGEVLIHGVPTSELSRARLADAVAAVPQKPFLFSGSVASNLRFGDEDATDETLWEALRVAQADDFVSQRDGGLDSGVSQGGTNVSGGQRQRLCIARALVARPDVYLFDDSFSALDVATDARLREALKPYTEDAAVILVAQRVSTITDADQILVLDHGEIVARGTHEQLLETSETYQEIVRSQISAEEVA
ncbi:MAG: ABC transporter ATP-binding protein [Galactobacter sp.]|uniref:ABC transporter ATP-binding protein n=1 Tax=Galactobacter sp. TaxID=2676125 RepID=UPI0025BA2FA5|nr:ABC transporter ATP-binding protein [Galactobacter sp.]